jgi:hypothetical protein
MLNRRSKENDVPTLVSIPEHSKLTGYTMEEIQQRIDFGMWAEGEVWVWGDNSERLISMQGYNEWARKPGHPLH